MKLSGLNAPIAVSIPIKLQSQWNVFIINGFMGISFFYLINYLHIKNWHCVLEARGWQQRQEPFVVLNFSIMNRTIEIRWIDALKMKQKTNVLHALKTDASKSFDANALSSLPAIT